MDTVMETLFDVLRFLVQHGPARNPEEQQLLLDVIDRHEHGPAEPAPAEPAPEGAPQS